VDAEVAGAAYKAKILAAFPGGMYIAPQGDNAGRYVVVTNVTMDGDTPVVEAFGPAAKSYDIAFEKVTEHPGGIWDVQTDTFGPVQIRQLSESERAQLGSALDEGIA
jgi:hypothetical protein